MLAHAIFFYVFSIIAVVSAVMVAVSKNTVHSVFFLILDFISISCLFIMIGAEFLGMIMLIVYVGAVAVLFLFVVMMLNVAQQKNQWFSSEASSKHIPVGLIISTLILYLFCRINLLKAIMAIEKEFGFTVKEPKLKKLYQKISLLEVMLSMSMQTFLNLLIVKKW